MFGSLNTWRTQTGFVGLDRFESILLWLPFSQSSSWPLCWWPYSKLILSSPMWQRGSTSGIHSITKGLASFGFDVPVPARVYRSVSGGRLVMWRAENKLTHQLWGRCGAPEALWVVGVLSCVPLAEVEVQDNGSASRCHRCSSQSSERAPGASEGVNVCVMWNEAEEQLIGWTEVTCAFTCGVSKMRLTCMRSVMCQVYLVKEPRGRPSFLTNTGLGKRRPEKSGFRSRTIGFDCEAILLRLPVVKLGSLFFLEPNESRCCRALKNSWGMW